MDLRPIAFKDRHGMPFGRAVRRWRFIRAMWGKGKPDKRYRLAALSIGSI